MFGEMLQNVRKKRPLIHSITNFVTVNDCANILLACGASPIMADDEREAAEITSACDGLCINIGTLSSRTIPSMLAAGKKANELCHPVVLDPVGVGASQFRTDTAFKLLNNIHFSVIRGNISEIKTLALGTGSAKGVDADIADRFTEETLDKAVAFAKSFSEKTGSVIAITGKTDIVGVGFDKSDAIMNLINDGYLLCTMAQNPDVMGKEGVKAAVRALEGEELGGAVSDTGVSVLKKN